MGRKLASPETVGALAARIGADIKGNAATQISSVASLSAATSGDVTFFSDKKFAKALAACGASAVIAPANAKVPPDCVHVIHPAPHQAFAKLLFQLFPENVKFIGADGRETHLSKLKEKGVIAPIKTSINPSSCIGKNTVIYPGARIGRDVKIGEYCVIYPNVVIMDRVVIGDRCVIQPGAVIGSDGFGFQPTASGWLKVPQVGTVIIGNDVEIGANTTIDRGAIEDTIIGNGVKIDNLVQIAHNVRIGDHTAIAGCAGIAGSAVIGARCMIGGAAMISGHLEIADDVTISGGTLVSNSISEKGRYTAVFPLGDHREWMRMAANVRRSAKKNRGANAERDASQDEKNGD